MKKYVIIGAVVVAILLVMLLLVKIFVADPAPAPAPEAQTEIPAEVLEPEFESAEQGFRVQGPEGWFKKADNLGMLVTYLNPEAVGDFQENISLAQEPKTDLDLLAYAEESKQQLASFFPGYTLLEQTEIIVQNQPALRLRYQIETDVATLVSEQLIIDRDDQWLVITLIAEASRFEPIYPNLTTLENSLEFLDE